MGVLLSALGGKGGAKNESSSRRSSPRNFLTFLFERTAHSTDQETPLVAVSSRSELHTVESSFLLHTLNLQTVLPEGTPSSLQQPSPQPSRNKVLQTSH